MEHSKKNFDSIVNLCKNRGFIFPGSEVYGGLANSWDYGPLGVEFKNNVKRGRARDKKSAASSAALFLCPFSSSR